MTGLAQHAGGHLPIALETIQNALAMAVSEGYLHTFVDAGPPMAALLYEALAHGIMPDFVSRLLQFFPTDPIPTVASPAPSEIVDHEPDENALIEPLSERELEVLQLMAGGATNEDIAEKLVIASTTAKKHVSNILHKLSAENRTKAVARGRSLGLCK
jgi:LuxR family maltose regulon positive regulatory protein